MSIISVFNTGKQVLPHLFTLNKFQTPYEAPESYIKCQKSLEEAQAFETKVKLESIRLFLESCIDSNGKFQEEKLPVLKDFVKSMGLNIVRCFKGNNLFETSWKLENRQAPAFYVTSTVVSEREQQLANANDTSLNGYYLMAYHYEEVTTSSGLHRIFRMEFMGDSSGKKKSSK